MEISASSSIGEEKSNPSAILCQHHVARPRIDEWMISSPCRHHSVEAGLHSIYVCTVGIDQIHDIWLLCQIALLMPWGDPKMGHLVDFTVDISKPVEYHRM